MAMRFSNEDGHSAAARNWGRLALMAIPAVLGLAAIFWIAAAFDWITFARTRRIEQRTMHSVGISEKPKAAVVLVNHDAPCLKIESSFMDGEEAVFYARNTCQRWLNMPNYSYRAMAKDGTVVQSGKYAFSGDMSMSAGERREQRVWFKKSDDRVERVELHAWD